MVHVPCMRLSAPSANVPCAHVAAKCTAGRGCVVRAGEAAREPTRAPEMHRLAADAIAARRRRGAVSARARHTRRAGSRMGAPPLACAGGRPHKTRCRAWARRTRQAGGPCSADDEIDDSI